MSSSRPKSKYQSAEEIIQKFLSVINGSQLFLKLSQVNKALSTGPLKIAREKFDALQTDEAITLLAQIEESYRSKLVNSLLDIFDEEQHGVKIILEEVDTVLSELSNLLDQLRQKISLEESPSEFVCGSYEDSRALLTFLKLKTNILKSHLAIPLSESVAADPFAHAPNFLEFEEENAIFILTKLTVVAESVA